jgi:hypothetical protein
MFDSPRATLTPVISWLRRVFGPPRPPVADVVDDRVTADEVMAYAESQVWPGFQTRADAVESVTAYFADSTGPTDRTTVSTIVSQVWHQREAVQATWSEPGDWGRLERAFADLERSGWIARMDFTCCQTCGHAEIGDERSGGEHSYVFFHAQDAEHLADPGPHLYLSYSYFDTHPGLDRDLVDAAEDSEDPELRERAWEQHARIETAVGATLVECLRRHGLVVEWDGSHETRPFVALRDWRKPLPVGP